MKKIIFILMTLAMIFVVFSCDEPKGTENTESTQTGTTSDNNTNTDTDNEDYIIQNPYEELEKTLTIKVNSIDEVEFSDGEWEYYFYSRENFDNLYFEELEEKGIMIVKDNKVKIKYDYYSFSEKYANKDDYLSYKENHKESHLIFDDENQTVYIPQEFSEDNRDYEIFLDDFKYYFHESYIDETEEYICRETHSAKTNSIKDAYCFFSEDYGKSDSELYWQINQESYKKIK